MATEKPANATLDTMLNETAVLGLEGFALADLDTDTVGLQGATVKSIGMYYMANDRNVGGVADATPPIPADPYAGEAASWALRRPIPPTLTLMTEWV